MLDTEIPCGRYLPKEWFRHRLLIDLLLSQDTVDLNSSGSMEKIVGTAPLTPS